MDKYERCVLAIKKKGGDYNPWAICTKTVGRKGGMPTKKTTSEGRRVYVGARGGLFYIKNDHKVYLR